MQVSGQALHCLHHAFIFQQHAAIRSCWPAFGLVSTFPSRVLGLGLARNSACHRLCTTQAFAWIGKNPETGQGAPEKSKQNMKAQKNEKNNPVAACFRNGSPVPATAGALARLWPGIGSLRSFAPATKDGRPWLGNLSHACMLHGLLHAIGMTPAFDALS